MGKKNENKKMKAPATPLSALLLVCDEVPAMIAMHVPIPRAANIISFLLPNRSTVSTPIGEQIACQVNTEALRIRAVDAENPRSCSKMVA